MDNKYSIIGDLEKVVLSSEKLQKLLISIDEKDIKIKELESLLNKKTFYIQKEFLNPYEMEVGREKLLAEKFLPVKKDKAFSILISSNRDLSREISIYESRTQDQWRLNKYRYLIGFLLGSSFSYLYLNYMKGFF